MLLQNRDPTSKFSLVFVGKRVYPDALNTCGQDPTHALPASLFFPELHPALAEKASSRFGESAIEKFYYVQNFLALFCGLLRPRVTEGCIRDLR